LASRRALLLVALAPWLGLARAADEAPLRPWSGPAGAPPIDLLRPDGLPLSLRDLRGKVVLVNFWATWCEPCIAEMPSLQRLRALLGTESFEILGVNFQEGPARIGAFVERTGVSFPIVRDTDGAVARAWNARVFP
jgi:thiol-disulfide isomerase/thioredoxin